MTVVRQLRTVLRVSIAGTVNSLRRRQGRGALVVFPLLVVFLLTELARFGSKASVGMQRVLERVPPARGAQYAAFWTLVLAVAITALKYARTIPARGARTMFDTTLFRALPVSPSTRVLCELAVGFTHSLGFVALVWVPTVWGLCIFGHGLLFSFVLTALSALWINSLTTVLAYALHLGVSRPLGARALDAVRVLAALVGIGLVGGFIAQGPIAAGVARTLTVTLRSPWWGRYEPTWSLAAWVLGLGGRALLAETLGLTLCLAALSVAVIVRRTREPTDLSLDTPPESRGNKRWVSDVRAWRAELQMLLRQAPYLPLAAPAFVAFFVILVRSAKKATGDEMPWIVLFGLVGWGLLVLGTMLSGAAARRWRRALWIPASAGADPRSVVRASAMANTAVTAVLALSPLAVLFQPRQPAWWWYPRQSLGMLAAIAVTQWLQSAAVFSMIDPAPDRLTGLSVGATFLVVAASMPGAAMAVILSAVPLAQWLGLLGFYSLFAWSLERSAVERLRWIREPDEDPLSEERSWPALRTFLVALLAQVVLTTLCADVLHVAAAPTLVLGYGAFAGVLIPMALGALRRGAPPAVSLRWAGLGALLGVANFALASGYARVASRLFGASQGPLTAALRSADRPTRAALVVIAALLGPISEELFFRAWLQPALKHDLPRGLVRWSFVLTAVIFAGVHSAEGWVTALAAGLVLGLLREKTGRIEACVAMHVTTNSLVMLAALR